jgi:hypothetical protein
MREITRLTRGKIIISFRTSIAPANGATALNAAERGKSLFIDKFGRNG